MTEVRILPILFNTDMVRAILDGKKSVTRRILKPQPNGTFDRFYECFYQDDELRVLHPPFVTDDVLYVRETWFRLPDDLVVDGERFVYRASTSSMGEEYRNAHGFKWHPSIHMPKEAARIFLRVTDVRVERLTSMSFTDLVEEGFVSGSVCEHKKEIAALEFSELWDSTIKRADLMRYGWDANPWVWRIAFERCEKPEGFDG